MANPAEMKAALELIGCNCTPEDEDGPVAGCLQYHEIELLCYAGLGLIPLKDGELKQRFDRLVSLSQSESHEQ